MFCFFYCYVAHRDLHVLTHSFPTRRSSDLDGDAIHAEDLRLPAQQSVTPAAVASAFVSANAAAASNPGTPTTPPDPRTLGPRETASSALPSYIEEIERAAIQQALQENRYNKTKAAAALGITFRALRYKLKKLGID